MDRRRLRRGPPGAYRHHVRTRRGTAALTDPPRRTVDELLAAARARFSRLTPAQSQAAQRRGALLIDIRPQHNRDTEGEIPDAVVVDRNVLEWRFDPQCDARLP